MSTRNTKTVTISLPSQLVTELDRVRDASTALAPKSYAKRSADTSG